MGIEIAQTAPVQPVVGPGAAADVAREALVVVRWREDEAEAVVVGVVREREGRGGAGDVEIEAAGLAVVGEAVAVVAAGIAAEEAPGVRGGGEE